MVIFVKHKYYFYRRFEHDIWGLCFLDIGTSKNPISYGVGFKSNKYLNNKNIQQMLKKEDLARYKVDRKKIILEEDKLDNIYSLVPRSWLLRFFFRLFAIAEERRYQRYKRYVYRIDIITHTAKRRKFNKKFLSLRVARLYFITLKDYQFRILFRRASKLDGNLESNYCLLLECRVMAIFYRTNFICNIFEILEFIKAGFVFINYKKAIYVNSSVTIWTHISCIQSTIPRLRHFLVKRLENHILMFNTPKFLFISFYFFFAYLYKIPKRKDFVYPFPLDIQRITGYN